jgi:hypothetical protein
VEEGGALDGMMVDVLVEFALDGVDPITTVPGSC